MLQSLREMPVTLQLHKGGGWIPKCSQIQSVRTLKKETRMIIQDSKPSPEISVSQAVGFRELREQVVHKGRGALCGSGVV